MFLGVESDPGAGPGNPAEASPTPFRPSGSGPAGASTGIQPDPSESDLHRASLVALLKLAYSGELAAAHAYNGHWRSVRNPGERFRIRSIENEEWQHRAEVGEMLIELGEAPDPEREARMRTVGKTIGFLCHVTGWLIPMYGAGRLESRNVMEYEEAALHASLCGWSKFVPDLLRMAEVEWEHEYYFRSKVLSHRLGRRIPLWTVPPPKSEIRSRFR